MKIILASSNPHKVKEINAIVQTIHENKDIEFTLPPAGFDPIEDGETFEENSLIKAKAAWELGKTWTLADDSGLCIDALKGAPGIHSARYAETPQARIDRVLKEMYGIENRSARFKCCMTLLNPKGEIAFSHTGICEGSIIESQRGVNGFGYDPIFLLKNSNKTMAELSEQDKNKVSHRFKALREVLNYLTNIS
jgi:XTP/dITP diphosphohydrolase